MFKLKAISWRGLLVDLLIAALLLLAVRTWLQWDMPSGPAPDFQLSDLSGQPATLGSYRGEPVVLHFWATWCPVCTAEQNSIQSISADYPVLGVAMQSGGTEAVSEHLDSEGLSFRNINDPHGELAARYGVSAVPATFILDGEGQIRFAERGWSSELGLRARLWWLD